MFKILKTNKTYEDKLYNRILLLSRNKFLYKTIGLNDSFQNRINLIFIHVAFLIIKLKQSNYTKTYADFYQRIFDLIFRKIELNMREIGYGDVSVNKNMKILVKNFYNILLESENYVNKSHTNKNLFLFKYLSKNHDENSGESSELVDYFNKYQAFCFDLSTDSVVKGELKFNYI